MQFRGVGQIKRLVIGFVGETGSKAWMTNMPNMHATLFSMAGGNLDGDHVDSDNVLVPGILPNLQVQIDHIIPAIKIG